MEVKAIELYVFVMVLTAKGVRIAENCMSFCMSIMEVRICQGQGHFCLSKDILGSITSYAGPWKIKRQILGEKDQERPWIGW